jgi:phage-related protein (TIGR01555 family)
MGTATLLAPVDRARKLETHIDRITGSGNSPDVFGSLGAWLGNSFFDRVTRAPKMTGPGEWQPGLSYRGDSWTNGVTGFGTALDKTTFTHYLPDNWLSDTSCEALFTGDDMVKRGVCTIPKEMLRKGYGIQLGGKPNKDAESAILDAATDLEVNQTFVRAMWWGALFGDGAVIIGADDGRPSMLELIPERVKKIDWLDAYDRRYYAINSYYTSGPKFGKPETYALGNPGMVTSPIQIVHETRMIRFGGAPTTTHMRQMRGGYDASKLQDVFEVLRAFATGNKAVEVLLTDGPQGVYKIKNLTSLIGSNNKSLFEQRLELVDKFRSAMRAVVVDADTESFERAQVSFAGIPDVMDRLALRQSAAWHMPITKLMGQSPAGLNATGEGDMRNWYDELETDQANDLAPALRKFYKILCATKEGPTGGKVPPAITFNFVPLYTLNPLDESQRRANVATTDKTYVDMGAATAEEVALSRFTERGYNADTIHVDRELRETLVDQDREAAMNNEPTPPKDALTPSANETVVTVNEARAMLGLEPDPDPIVGAMKLAELKAKLEAASAPGAHATDPEQNRPNGEDPAEIAKREAEALASGPGAPGKAPNANPRKDPNQPSASGPGGAPPKKKAPF